MDIAASGSFSIESKSNNFASERLEQKTNSSNISIDESKKNTNSIEEQVRMENIQAANNNQSDLSKIGEVYRESKEATDESVSKLTESSERLNRSDILELSSLSKRSSNVDSNSTDSEANIDRLAEEVQKTMQENNTSTAKGFDLYT